MKDTEKTATILKALKNKFIYGGRLTNVLFPELRLGSGYSDISQRRIDLFMISSEKGNYTTAFEIKVSRGDFLKDIKDELKQRGARLYSSNFYYVAPKDMIKIEEIPMWAGLLEYDFETKQFQTKIVAPLQNRNAPSWSLICSLVRRVNENVYAEKIWEQENVINYYKRELNSAVTLLKKIANDECKDQTTLEWQLSKYKHKDIVQF